MKKMINWLLGAFCAVTCVNVATASGIQVFKEVGSYAGVHGVSQGKSASEYTTVELGKCLDNPVVIAKSMTSNSPQPAIVLTQNIRCNGGFKTIVDVRIQEFGYQDGVSPGESVAVMAIEEGVHYIPGLGDIAAFTVELTVNEWLEVPMPLDAGIVITTVSDLEADQQFPPVVRQHRDNDGLQLMLQVEEAQASRVSYTATVNVVIFGKDLTTLKEEPKSTNHRWRHIPQSKISLGEWVFNAYPLFFSDLQTTNDDETAYMRVDWALAGDGYQIRVKAQEEKSNDREIRHGQESGGIVHLGKRQGTLIASNIEQEISTLSDEEHAEFLLNYRQKNRLPSQYFLQETSCSHGKYLHDLTTGRSDSPYLGLTCGNNPQPVRFIEYGGVQLRSLEAFPFSRRNVFGQGIAPLTEANDFILENNRAWDLIDQSCINATGIIIVRWRNEQLGYPIVDVKVVGQSCKYDYYTYEYEYPTDTGCDYFNDFTCYVDPSLRLRKLTRFQQD